MLRSARFTVPLKDSRDHGKTYEIVEMPAEKAEWWACRALLAIGKQNDDVGEVEMLAGGMENVARVGIKAFFKVDPLDLKPLLDEMMECVWFLPSGPQQPELKRRPMGDDIQEASTRLMLRMEVFKLHTGFSFPGGAQSGSTSSPTSGA